MPTWASDDASKLRVTLSVDGKAISTITLTATSDGVSVPVSDDGVLQGVAHFSIAEAQNLTFFVQAFSFHGGGKLWMLCSQNHRGLKCYDDATNLVIEPARDLVAIGEVVQGVPLVVHNVGLVGPF